MKKKYFIPSIRITVLEEEYDLLADSPTGPTTTEGSNGADGYGGPYPPEDIVVSAKRQGIIVDDED